MNSVGVSGYDPILGALSPSLRILAHTSGALLFSSLAVVLFGSTSNEDKCEGPLALSQTNLLTLMATSLAYVILWAAYDQYGRPVSWPGDPRPHKIQRQPQWKDRSIELPNHSFQCVAAQSSHDLPDSGPLTGEPAGRDVWSTQGPNPPRIWREGLVQEMASGGRPAGFNPAVNPNR